VERNRYSVDDHKAWLTTWFHPHNEYDIGFGNWPAPSGDWIAAVLLAAIAIAVVVGLVLEIAVLVAVGGLMLALGLVALALRVL
jgi:hypothetical protein